MSQFNSTLPFGDHPGCATYRVQPSASNPLTATVIAEAPKAPAASVVYVAPAMFETTNDPEYYFNQVVELFAEGAISELSAHRNGGHPKGVVWADIDESLTKVTFHVNRYNAEGSPAGQSIALETVFLYDSELKALIQWYGLYHVEGIADYTLDYIPSD